jgi:hypothetical protein
MVKAYTQDCGDMVMYLFNKCKVGFPCACLTTRITGEPYSGNLYLRFDEGLGHKPPSATLLAELIALGLRYSAYCYKK